LKGPEGYGEFKGQLLTYPKESQDKTRRGDSATKKNEVPKETAHREPPAWLMEPQ